MSEIKKKKSPGGFQNEDTEKENTIKYIWSIEAGT